VKSSKENNKDIESAIEKAKQFEDIDVTHLHFKVMK